MASPSSSSAHSGNPLDKAPANVAWDVTDIAKQRAPTKKVVPRARVAAATHKAVAPTIAPPILFAEPIAITKNEPRLPPGPEVVILNVFDVTMSYYFDKRYYIYLLQGNDFVIVGKYIKGNPKLAPLSTEEIVTVQSQMKVTYRHDNNNFLPTPN